MMLEGAGYKVIDLGVDVPAEQFLRVGADGFAADAASAVEKVAELIDGQ